MEAAGTDEVEGVEVARYRFGIDMEKAAAASGDRREGVEGLMTFRGDIEPVITGEVTIDGGGRVRTLDILGELEVTEDEGAAGLLGTDSISLALRVRMLGDDEPVEVVAPPADETVELAEVPGLTTLLAS